jgi:hypothetical protein
MHVVILSGIGWRSQDAGRRPAGLGPMTSDTMNLSAGVATPVPPHLLAAYRERWAPAYAALEIWPATGEPVPSDAAYDR